jgi:hypothetical protein
LHVLSLPLAFILSQDQTLHSTFSLFIIYYTSQRSKPNISKAISNLPNYSVISFLLFFLFYAIHPIPYLFPIPFLFFPFSP